VEEYGLPKYPSATFINVIPDFEIIDGMAFVTITDDGKRKTFCYPVRLFIEDHNTRGKCLENWRKEQDKTVQGFPVHS
jgi:hypothetical protein